MDTGIHFSITTSALRKIAWFPQEPSILKTIQAFNWFPDFLSIIDLYKKWFYLFGWLDYLPLYIPTYGITEFRAYHTYNLIKSLSKDTIAGKYFHQCHFDNLFTFKAVYDHWKWLKKQVTEYLNVDNSSIKTLAVLGNSLHAVQDFYSHSNWVEFFTQQGIHSMNIPLWSEMFLSVEQKWDEIREQLFLTQQMPVHTIFTGYYKPAKIIPPNAYYHDDKKNGRPGLNKDKPSRPYFEISYILAIKESIQWLQQLYKDGILTDRHIASIQKELPINFLKKVEFSWERAQTLSKKTKHWNGMNPFRDIHINFRNLNTVYNKSQKYIQGKVTITTSEDLKKTKRNFFGAYIDIIIKKSSQIIGQTFMYTKKDGSTPFKILLLFESDPMVTNTDFIQLEAHYGPYNISTVVKI